LILLLCRIHPKNHPKWVKTEQLPGPYTETDATEARARALRLMQQDTCTHRLQQAVATV
jgi:hypothetical protein